MSNSIGGEGASLPVETLRLLEMEIGWRAGHHFAVEGGPQPYSPGRILLIQEHVKNRTH